MPITFDPTSQGRSRDLRCFTRGAALLAAVLLVPFGACGAADEPSEETAAAQCRRLEQHLGSFDPAACVRAVRAAQVSESLPDEPSWVLRRQVAPHAAYLPLLKKVVSRVLADPREDVARSASLYAVAARWLALDAACEALGVASCSGVGDALPAPCRPSTAPPFVPARRLRLRVSRPSVRLTVFGVPDALSGESLGLGKTAEEVRAEVEPRVLAASTAAAIWLPLDVVDAKSHQDNAFAVSINDRISLFLRYARKDFPPEGQRLPGLYHTFDPRFLTRSNRLRVTMPSLPGLDSRMGEVYFEWIELWLGSR